MADPTSIKRKREEGQGNYSSYSSNKTVCLILIIFKCVLKFMKKKSLFFLNIDPYVQQILYAIILHKKYR